MEGEMDTELLRLSLADGLTLLDEDRLSLWLGDWLVLVLALVLGLLDGTDT